MTCCCYMAAREDTNEVVVSGVSSLFLPDLELSEDVVSLWPQHPTRLFEAVALKATRHSF